MNYLDSWKYQNVYTDQTLKETCKEILQEIVGLSKNIKKLPLNKLKREYLDQFINLSKKFEEINTLLLDYDRVNIKLDFIDAYKTVIEKLILSEEMKLKNSHQESSLNLHAANIDYLTKLSKDVGKTFREIS